MFEHRGSFPFRGWLIGLALFSAISALAGGVEMLIWPHGNDFVPLSLLTGSGFKSFLVPGLLLALVVGGSALGASILAWKRSRYSLPALGFAGAALFFWIVIEVLLIQELHWLHFLYGALGLSIFSLALASYRSARLF